MPEKIFVKDIMTKPVVIVSINSSVYNAAKILTKNRVGTLIVVKNKNPVGIVTDTDIIKKVVAKAKNSKDIKIKDIMATPILFLSPNDNLLQAEERMRRHKIKRMPVIKNGKLLGIVSITDIARATPKMLDLLNFRLRMRQSEPLVEETPTSGICDSCENYSGDLEYINGRWLCEDCRER